MKKKLKSNFKCTNTLFHGGTCKSCFEIHNMTCYYSVVVNFKPEWKRNLCPICINNKNIEKCKLCVDSEKNRKKSRYIF